jgi:hypothetical protein
MRIMSCESLMIDRRMRRHRRDVHLLRGFCWVGAGDHRKYYSLLSGLVPRPPSFFHFLEISSCKRC